MTRIPVVRLFTRDSELVSGYSEGCGRDFSSPHRPWFARVKVALGRSSAKDRKTSMLAAIREAERQLADLKRQIEEVQG